MNRKSQYVIAWRKRLKNKIVMALGGKCIVCGYNKCNEALDFHHINPKEKEFSFGKIRANPKKIKGLINELNKCVLVCSNCHREIHYGIISLNMNISRIYDFDNLISEVEIKRKLKQQLAFKSQIKKDRRKIFLNKGELEDMLNTNFNGNKSALARYLCVSETAIRKHLL